MSLGYLISGIVLILGVLWEAFETLQINMASVVNRRAQSHKAKET